MEREFHVRTDIQVGMIAEGCNLHIGKVVSVNNDPKNDHVQIESMFDGKVYNCGLYTCGVVEQTPEQIIVKKLLYQYGGMKAVGEYYEQMFELADKNGEIKWVI